MAASRGAEGDTPATLHAAPLGALGETGTDPSNRRRSGPHRGCPLRWEAYRWRKVRLSILGGPDDAGAALPPEATLELRADPSVGRIRLLTPPPSSAWPPPTGAPFLPERTSVLVRAGKAR